MLQFPSSIAQARRHPLRVPKAQGGLEFRRLHFAKSVRYIRLRCLPFNRSPIQRRGGTTKIGRYREDGLPANLIAKSRRSSNTDHVHQRPARVAPFAELPYRAGQANPCSSPENAPEPADLRLLHGCHRACSRAFDQAGKALLVQEYAPCCTSARQQISEMFEMRFVQQNASRTMNAWSLSLCAP